VPGIISIAVKLGLYIDLMLLIGLPMFALYALRGTEHWSRPNLALQSILATLALVGIGLSSLSMMPLAESAGGVLVAHVNRTSVSPMLSSIASGTMWQVRVTALVLGLYFSILGWRRTTFALCSISATAAIALATMA